MPNALVVDHVTKEYRIGHLAHETMLREALMHVVRRGLRPVAKKNDQTVRALEDVSFAVEKGGVVGVIGRNGSGKSTLLKILSRITYPTSGQIHVEGRVASLLEVGTGFHEELTGRENIYLNGSILGMKKREIDSRLDEIVDFAAIGRFLDTPIKRYSSGMRLRLGFAVAAHLQTDVLLVDEVLAVGDFEFQKKCLSKIENLHQGGRTVLFVSHNVAAVEHICPRTLWIDNGHVRQDGDTEEVMRNYLACFSGKRHTGSNLRDIQEREGTGEVRLTGIDILDPHGQAQAVTYCGDPLVIRLHYDAVADMRDAEFGMCLYTGSEVKVASLGTEQAGYLIPSLPAGEGYIDLGIESATLVPGRYSISVWATGPNHDRSSKHCWDLLKRCATLDIEPSDFYKSGRGVDKGSGIVLMRYKWSLAASHGRMDSTAGVITASEKSNVHAGGAPRLYGR